MARSGPVIDQHHAPVLEAQLANGERCDGQPGHGTGRAFRGRGRRLRFRAAAPEIPADAAILVLDHENARLVDAEAIHLDFPGEQRQQSDANLKGFHHRKFFFNEPGGVSQPHVGEGHPGPREQGKAHVIAHGHRPAAGLTQVFFQRRLELLHVHESRNDQEGGDHHHRQTDDREPRPFQCGFHGRNIKHRFTGIQCNFRHMEHSGTKLPRPCHTHGTLRAGVVNFTQ